MTREGLAQPDDSEISDVLERLGVIVYTTDRQGRLTSLRGPVETLLGYTAEEIQAKPADAFIAPESRDAVRGEMRRKLKGEAEITIFEFSVVAKDASRVRVQVTSAPLRERDQIVGIMGIGHAVGERKVAMVPAESPLTQRQLQVLQLLAEGLSTRAIAARLSISQETARNHIRRILGSLGCHSRLEAVAKARRLWLI